MHPALIALFFIVGAVAVLAASSEAATYDFAQGDAPSDDLANLGGGSLFDFSPGFGGLSIDDEKVTAMPSRKVFDVPPEGAQYAEAIRQAEVRYGLPESLLARVIYRESRYRQDIITGKVRSSAGAIGIAQFMPGTAKHYGINPLDPFASIEAAAKYLRNNFNLLGTWEKAVAGYNWGEGNVLRQGLSAAPAETRDYIRDVFNDVSV